jgi:phosphoheptose isomerase
LVLCISTSGASQNVVDAAITARDRLATTVVLVGKHGSALGNLCDAEFCMKCDHVGMAEDLFSIFLHAAVYSLSEGTV